MKKKVQVKIPAKKASVVEKEVTVCDFCDEGGSRRSKYQCVICERDVCRECLRYDPDEFGDYPDKYCPECYELRFNTYYEEINNIKDRAERAVDKVIDRIEIEVLKVKCP